MTHGKFLLTTMKGSNLVSDISTSYRTLSLGKRGPLAGASEGPEGWSGGFRWGRGGPGWVSALVGCRSGVQGCGSRVYGWGRGAGDLRERGWAPFSVRGREVGRSEISDVKVAGVKVAGVSCGAAKGAVGIGVGLR